MNPIKLEFMPLPAIEMPIPGCRTHVLVTLPSKLSPAVVQLPVNMAKPSLCEVRVHTKEREARLLSFGTAARDGKWSASYPAESNTGTD